MSKGQDGKDGRLGDATLARIDDLKGGWKLPGAPAAEEEPPAEFPPAPPPSVRSKGPTKPPPTRAKEPSIPPPPPPASPKEASSAVPSGALPSLPKPKASAASAPVPVPVRAKAATAPPAAPVANATSTRSQSFRAKTPSKAPHLPAAPVVSSVGVDDDEPTRLTTFDAPDGVAPRAALSASGHATGSVRLPDSLPRSSGVLGDIAYLFRVLAKKRSTRRELLRNAERIANEKEARNHKLLEMARHAIGDERMDLSLIDRARAALLDIEEKRSLHAGRVAAADEKVSVLERHLSEEQIRKRTERERVNLEIAAIDTSLQPLVKRTTEARKLTSKLHRQLKVLDDKIRSKQASLVSVDGPANAAAVHAEVASLQAERDTVAAEEPDIAAEVDDLEPKIASLKSTRGELERKLEILDREHALDELRVAEKVSAVKATRVVEDRAVSDQSVRRQDKLLELGEALHNEPPDAANPRLKAVVKHDLEIGTLERRRLELLELMDTIERAPMVRAVLYLLLFVGALSAGLLLALSR